MIRSAVRTTLCSLLRSYLVVEPNHTVIDLQRTDSMIAEYNYIKSSCGQVELPQLTKEIQPLLGLFHNGLNVSVPLLVLGDGVAQDLNDSTAVTVLFMMVSGGGRAGEFLLKSTIISTLLSVLSSRLLRLHQTASSLTSCL